MAVMELMEALIRDCLPDDLSILQWVYLMHPDPDNQADYDDPIKRKRLKLNRKIETEEILGACSAGLKHYGNIKGWSWLWGWGAENPYPLIDITAFSLKVVRC